jgi:uncharacterized protein (DUF4415 family)
MMMTADDDTRQFSLDALKKKRDRGQTETRTHAPERSVEADFWASAHVVMPPPGKASVHIRLDTDVLEWFRAQGKGHLTRMNAVLRSFMEAHRGKRRDHNS